MLVRYGLCRDIFMLEEYQIVGVFKVSISLGNYNLYL